MKKSIVTIVLSILSITTYGQISIGLGGAKSKNEWQLVIPIKFEYLLVELGTNCQKGKGDYLEFWSDESYPTGKTGTFYWAAGPSVPIQIHKFKMAVSPKFGQLIADEIWEDPILYTTNFVGRQTKSFYYGCNLDFTIHKNVMLSLLTGFTNNSANHGRQKYFGLALSGVINYR